MEDVVDVAFASFLLDCRDVCSSSAVDDDEEHVARNRRNETVNTNSKFNHRSFGFNVYHLMLNQILLM